MWSLCSRGLVVLSCPPLHSMRQCFGPGPRTKPEARCSAPASPERRLSLTLHQLGGRHSRLCVCVYWSPFSLLLWSKTKWSADHLFLPVLKLWGVIGRGTGRKRQLTMAVRIIRGMEDLVASSSQLVWSMAHQTLRRWYNGGMMPCRRLLEAWFRIGKCYQVWQLLELWRRKKEEV